MYSLMLLLLCVCCAWAEHPNEDNAVARGAQIRLSKVLLQYLANIEVKALQSKVKNLRLPDQHGGGSHFSFDASNILIKYLSVRSQSFTTIPNVGVKFAVGGITVPASARVHVQYKRGWVKVSDTTNVDVTASGVSLSLSIRVTVVNGKPHVAVTNCGAHIGGLSLHFHGGLAWLYNLLKGILEGKLRGVLANAICSQGSKLINDNGNKALQQFPTRMNIKDYAYVDYSFQQPLFTSQFLDLYARGEFLDYHHPAHSKLVPPQFETTSSSSKMVYVWLTDYSINTAAEVFHNAKLLRRIIKIGDKIPPGVEMFMNTKTLKEIIPQLYKKYPDRPIQLGLDTFKPPHFELIPGEGKVELFVRVGLNVVLENKDLVPVFYIDLSVTASGMANVKTVNNQVNVGGFISSFNFKLAVGGSVIGRIVLPVDNKSIQALVRGVVIDQANPFLEHGFPLPQTNVLVLKSPSITMIKNAVRVDTQVELHV